MARLLAETPQVVLGDEAELRGLRRLGVLRTLEYPEHKNFEFCEEYTILQVLAKQVRCNPSSVIKYFHQCLWYWKIYLLLYERLKVRF